MYNTIKKIFAFLVMFVGVFAYNAVSASEFAFSNPLQVVSQDAQSVTISWDKIPWSTGYLVVYGSQSSADGMYENELSDLVEETQATISGLQAGQTVYIAVVAMDSNFDEAAISEELSVVVSETVSSNSSFSVQRVEVISESEVRVVFSWDVENSEASVREFFLAQKEDKTGEVAVVSSRVENNNTVVLNLAIPLVAEKEYDLVVISISDVNGNTIQSGADGMVTFVAPSFVPDLLTEIFNAADVEVTDVSTWSEVWGDILGEVEVEVVAAEAEELPQTGPKEVMMILLALLLGLAIVLLRKRA